MPRGLLFPVYLLTPYLLPSHKVWNASLHRFMPLKRKKREQQEAKRQGRPAQKEITKRTRSKQRFTQGEKMEPHDNRVSTSASSFSSSSCDGALWAWGKEEFTEWLDRLFRERLGRAASSWVVKQCLSIVESSPPHGLSPSSSSASSTSWSLSRASSVEGERKGSIHIERLLNALGDGANTKVLYSQRQGLHHPTTTRITSLKDEKRSGAHWRKERDTLPTGMLCA